VAEAAARYDDPETVVPLIEAVLETHKQDLADFRTALEEAAGKANPAVIKLLEYAETEDVAAKASKFSFVDRMTMECAENLQKFDAIVSVGEVSVPPLQTWVGDPEKVRYIRNGFNSNIYKPDAYQWDTFDTSVVQAQMLTAKAYAFNDNASTLSDTQADGYNARQTDRLQHGTTFIGISRPDERKGSGTAIQAFVEWALEHPEDKGTLILGAHKPNTNPPEGFSATLVNMVHELDAKHPELQLKERVLLLPSLAVDQARRLYDLPRAVGLCPSEREPFGLVALEQSGSGLPIVASDGYQAATDMKQNMQKKGESIIQFEAGNPASMAAAMGKVSESYEKYQKAAVGNAKDVIDEFTWKKTGAEYRKVYDDTFEIVKNNITPYKLALHPRPLVGAGGTHAGVVQQSHEHGMIMS
jgi:glycosyltransferase involved in cell wall biosynthesis